MRDNYCYEKCIDGRCPLIIEDKIKYNDRLIFQKFLIISVFRFKRGLVFLPDET